MDEFAVTKKKKTWRKNLSMPTVSMPKALCLVSLQRDELYDKIKTSTKKWF
jgi:hypothetical protein